MPYKKQDKFYFKSEKDVDYTLEDEEEFGDLKKAKKHKNSAGFFSGLKSKVAALKDKNTMKLFCLNIVFLTLISKKPDKHDTHQTARNPSG